jgi:hypothetical protein
MHFLYSPGDFLSGNQLQIVSGYESCVGLQARGRNSGASWLSQSSISSISEAEKQRRNVGICDQIKHSRSSALSSTSGGRWIDQSRAVTDGTVIDGRIFSRAQRRPFSYPAPGNYIDTLNYSARFGTIRFCIPPCIRVGGAWQAAFVHPP